jgi:hypothetical protein
MSSIYGKDFTLGNDCIIGKSSIDFQELILSIKAKNLVLVYLYGKKVLDDVSLYCPISDFNRLYNDFWKSIQQKQFLINLFKHSEEIWRIIQEQINYFIHFDFNPIHIGYLFGTIVKIGVFNMSNSNDRNENVHVDVESKNSPIDKHNIKFLE